MNERDGALGPCNIHEATTHFRLVEPLELCTI
jgi:hypothetical protein